MNLNSKKKAGQTGFEVYMAWPFICSNFPQTIILKQCTTCLEWKCSTYPFTAVIYVHGKLGTAIRSLYQLISHW